MRPGQGRKQIITASPDQHLAISRKPTVRQLSLELSATTGTVVSGQTV